MQYKYFGIEFSTDPDTEVHDGLGCIVLVRPIDTKRGVCTVEGECLRIGYYVSKMTDPCFIVCKHTTNTLLASLLKHCEEKTLFPVPACILLDAETDPFMSRYIPEMTDFSQRGYQFTKDKKTLAPFRGQTITVDFWKSLS